MQSKAIEVIRHSLAAASAALNLLETDSPVRQEVTVVEEAASAALSLIEEPSAPVVSDPDPRFIALMNELDGRYSLRTVAELEDKLGISFRTMTDLLNDEGVSFVTRTRRSDSALLIGLDFRN